MRPCRRENVPGICKPLTVLLFRLENPDTLNDVARPDKDHEPQCIVVHHDDSRVRSCSIARFTISAYDISEGTAPPKPAIGRVFSACWTDFRIGFHGLCATAGGRGAWRTVEIDPQARALEL